MVKPIEEASKLKLSEILTDVYQSSIGIEEAEKAIKIKLHALLKESSIGIGSCDATELWGDMNKGIESL